ncbi:chaps-domain-containing protein [Neoconidiobolus thromboides FSU 785]|nr:chaps-domain-containing protein [Neoconidiobolus thromboides FSU 785]
MGDTLKDIPEFFENDMGECVTTRTLALSTCRELGPPDLCHVIKTNSKPNIKELGCYHFVLGLDASSSATMAAYLNSLTYLMEVPQGWFAKAPVWRVRSGIYCCYNAFSRVDIRVEVKIPGGVEAYAVNNKAEKIPIKDEYWVETYISAVLRSMHYSDDLTYKVDGLRYFNIIPDLDSEVRFFEAVESLFWKGHLIGGEADLQFPTNVNNYLTDGIMKYLISTGRYHSGINLFAKLAEIDPEINSLLAKCYIDTDQEILAVQALCKGLKLKPSSYALLLTQAEFLIKKGRLDLATILTRRAVNVAPSEFRSWIKLAELYVELKEYKTALLTLNSCPMFAINERELPKMPTPQRTHFPQKSEAILAYGLEEDPEAEQESSTALSRLPGNALKGTFAKAYKLLTLIASKIGWDELLHHRSSSFVMEEEYRMQKTKEDVIQPNTKQSVRNGSSHSMKSPPSNEEKNENSIEKESSISTTLEVPDNSKQVLNNNESHTNDNIEINNEINNEIDTDLAVKEIEPTQEDVAFEEIKTTENENENENEEGNKEEKEKEPEKEHESESENSVKEGSLNENNDGFNDVSLTPNADEKSDNEISELEKPYEDLVLNNNDISISSNNSIKEGSITKVNDDSLSSKSAAEDSPVQSVKNISPPPSQLSNRSDSSSKFNHKRLCERWLDNLFMVLYEDLRAFTSWRAEMSGTRSQRLTYRYSGHEWESLGDLCLRLHRIEEGQDAYTNCVHQLFSPRSWAFLLEQHTKDNELQLIMGALIRLAMYFEKLYNSCQIPNQVMMSLKHIIGLHGLTKIKNLLLSLDLAPDVLKVINKYIDIAITFQMKGTEEIHS